MNKITFYMKHYLLYGFPLAFILLIWSLGLGLSQTMIKDTHILLRIVYTLLNYNLIIWFLTLVLYMFLLVIVPSVRDKPMRRLSNIKERDEREEYITGKAARASYIATLSLTLFLLFFSLINFKVSKLSPSDPKKPSHSMSINLHYSIFKESAINESIEERTKTIFDSNHIYPSTSTVLLIFLGWQLLVFNVAARKER